MAVVKTHSIKVTFVVNGTRITRTFDLRDVSLANAKHRAVKLVPATATIEAVK